MGGRETIRFESTDPSVSLNGTDRTTNVGGVATLDYRRDSDSGATEWITARQYWAARIPAGTSGSGEVIIVYPANNRAVVVAGNDVWLVDYTTADRLQIGNERVRILTFKEAPNRRRPTRFPDPSNHQSPQHLQSHQPLTSKNPRHARRGPGEGSSQPSQQPLRFRESLREGQVSDRIHRAVRRIGWWFVGGPC